MYRFESLIYSRMQSESNSYRSKSSEMPISCAGGSLRTTFDCCSRVYQPRLPLRPSFFNELPTLGMRVLFPIDGYHSRFLSRLKDSITQLWRSVKTAHFLLHQLTSHNLMLQVLFHFVRATEPYQLSVGGTQSKL